MYFYTNYILLNLKKLENNYKIFYIQLNYYNNNLKINKIFKI